MTRLTVRRGPEPGTVHELTDEIVTIGRSPHNTIVIGDDQISRTHVRLVRVGPDYELHDLGSSNGAFVDGQRVTTSWLLPPVCLIELGDSITLAYERTLPKADGALPAAERRSEHPFLVVNLGPDLERIYALESETITVGRDLSNNIVLPDPEVSRWHLELQRQGGGYTVRDLGSTNGTILNGVRLNGTRALTAYDALELGTGVRLHYVRDPKDVQGGQASPARENMPRAEMVSKLDTNEVRQADLLNLIGKRKTSRLGTGLIQGALDQHIIIAYAREDWESVIAPLTVALQDAGIDVWVDQYLKPGADDWTAAIDQALTECWLLVLVVSPAAIESRHVRLEYRHFVNREKPMLLFTYRPVDRLPPELAGVQAIAYDPANSMSSFRRLILEILHRRL
jgi:pSer/pThr/pTyr-binding forkhead associated (FHA) protein